MGKKRSPDRTVSRLCCGQSTLEPGPTARQHLPVSRCSHSRDLTPPDTAPSSVVSIKEQRAEMSPVLDAAWQRSALCPTWNTRTPSGANQPLHLLFCTARTLMWVFLCSPLNSVFNQPQLMSCHTRSCLPESAPRLLVKQQGKRPHHPAEREP